MVSQCAARGRLQARLAESRLGAVLRKVEGLAEHTRRSGEECLEDSEAHGLRGTLSPSVAGGAGLLHNITKPLPWRVVDK